MTDVVNGAFFGSLADGGPYRLLKNASGAVRFEIADGDHLERWRIAMSDGNVTVTRGSARADAVVRLPKATFRGLTDGTVNAMAAVLRGEIVVEGDIGLLLLLQRLFPSATPSATPSRTSGAP